MESLTATELNLSENDLRQLRVSNFDDTHQLAIFLLRMPKFPFGERQRHGASFSRHVNIKTKLAGVSTKNTGISIWNPEGG